MVSLARPRRGLIAAAVVAVVVSAATAVTQTTDGVPAVVLALVLAPAATAATFLVAGRVGGERFAVGASWVYALLPLLGNRYMLPVYRPTFDGHALPALTGVVAPWRLVVATALALAVALAPKAVFAGAGIAAALVAAVLWLGSIDDLRNALHESVWSVGLLEWLLVAAVLAVAIRARPAGIACAGWLAAVILWGGHRSYDGAAFWETLTLAAPAAAVLLSSVALLVPRLRPARAPLPSR